MPEHCKNEGRCIDFAFAPSEWREKEICHICGCDGDTRSRPEREKLLDKFEHWLDIRERRALKAGADNHAEAFYDAREYLWELRKGEQK